MIISDLNYCVAIEDAKIEGSGEARMYSTRRYSITAQSDAIGDADEQSDIVAETGFKSVTYSSFVSLQGLT